MGYRSNPVSLRLGVNRWWAAHRFFRKSLRESFIEHQLFRYVENAFDRYIFRRVHYVYSHSTLSFGGRICFVTAYMYGHDMEYFDRRKRWRGWGRRRRNYFKCFSSFRRDFLKFFCSFKYRFGEFIRVKGRYGKIGWRRLYKWLKYKKLKALKYRLKCRKRRRFYLLRRFGKRVKLLGRVCNLVSVLYVKKFLVGKYLKRSYLKVKSKLVKLKRIRFLLRRHNWTGYFRRLVSLNKCVVAYELFCKLKLFRVIVFVKKASPMWAPPAVLVRFVVRKLRYKYTLNELIYPIILGTKRKLFGVYARCSGRFTRAQRARLRVFRSKNHPMNTFCVSMDSSYQYLALKYGACSVKLCMVLDNRRVIRKSKVAAYIKLKTQAEIEGCIDMTRKKGKFWLSSGPVKDKRKDKDLKGKHFKGRYRKNKYKGVRRKHLKKRKYVKKFFKRRRNRLGFRFLYNYRVVVYNRFGSRVGLKREFRLKKRIRKRVKYKLILVKPFIKARIILKRKNVLKKKNKISLKNKSIEIVKKKLVVDKYKGKDVKLSQRIVFMMVSKFDKLKLKFRALELKRRRARISNYGCTGGVEIKKIRKIGVGRISKRRLGCEKKLFENFFDNGEEYFFNVQTQNVIKNRIKNRIKNKIENKIKNQIKNKNKNEKVYKNKKEASFNKISGGERV